MADLVGSFIQAEVNRRAQERSFEQQQQLQADAQAYNTFMFNMSNQYNSPVQQMSRFKAAGLNPNLIYGQMANTSSPIGMSSSSSPSPASIQAPSMLESAQIGLLDAQKENIKADTDSKRSDIDLNDATIAKYGVENNWTLEKIKETQANVNKINEEVSNLKETRNVLTQQVNLLKSQKNLTDWQAVEQMVDALWADERNRATIDNICAQTNLTNSQAKEILTLMYAKLANINADTRLKNADASTSIVLRSLYRSQKEGQDISNSQSVERFDEDMQLLEQAISQGKITADLNEKFPGTMMFIDGLGRLLGAAGPLLTPAAVVYSGKKVSSGVKYNSQTKTYTIPRVTHN